MHIFPILKAFPKPAHRGDVRAFLRVEILKNRLCRQKLTETTYIDHPIRNKSGRQKEFKKYGSVTLAAWLFSQL